MATRQFLPVSKRDHRAACRAAPWEQGQAPSRYGGCVPFVCASDVSTTAHAVLPRPHRRHAGAHRCSTYLERRRPEPPPILGRTRPRRRCIDGKSHMHNFRLRRGVAWISHGPADLRDFVIKQSWISARPRDRDHGAPPVFLRGPLIDIRKGIASLYKWEQEIKPTSPVPLPPAPRPFWSLAATMDSRSSARRSDPVRHLSEKMCGPPACHRTIRAWQVSWICSTLGRSRAVSTAAWMTHAQHRPAGCRARSSHRTGFRGTQVLLSKSYEALDGNIETNAEVLELDKPTAGHRAAQMEKLTLRPNVRLDSFHKRFFWMGKCTARSAGPSRPNRNKLDLFPSHKCPSEERYQHQRKNLSVPSKRKVADEES